MTDTPGTRPGASAGAGTGPVVREAAAGDAAAIAALQARSWQAAYRGIAPDAFLDALTEDTWLGRWTDALGGAPRDEVHQLVSTAGPDGPPRAVAVCGPAFEPSGSRNGHHGWARDGATQREDVAGATFDEVRMVRGLTDPR